MIEQEVKQNGHIPTMQLPNDLDELRALYIEQGGNPNHKPFQAGISRAKELGIREFKSIQQQADDERGEWANKAKTAIMYGLYAIAVAFVFVALLVGTVVGLILLVAAEVAAVSKGFTVIDSTFAGLYAAATVLFFLVVLFIREIIAHNTVEEPSPVFSLRHFAEWLLYFVGWSGNWKTRYRTPSLLSRVDNAIAWLTWTIVLFGLLGRLADTVNEFSGTWIEGLRHIAEQSTLSEMVGIVGAGVMTIALLRATHFIVYFTHRIFLKVTGGLDMRENFSSSASQSYFVEAEVAKYYQNEILRLKARNQTYLTATNDQQPVS